MKDVFKNKWPGGQYIVALGSLLDISVEEVWSWMSLSFWEYAQSEMAKCCPHLDDAFTVKDYQHVICGCNAFFDGTPCCLDPWMIVCFFIGNMYPQL